MKHGMNCSITAIDIDENGKTAKPAYTLPHLIATILRHTAR